MPSADAVGHFARRCPVVTMLYVSTSEEFVGTIEDSYMFEKGDLVRSRYWMCDCYVRFDSRHSDLATCVWEHVCKQDSKHYIYRTVGSRILFIHDMLEEVDSFKQFVLETRRQAEKE